MKERTGAGEVMELSRILSMAVVTLLKAPVKILRWDTKKRGLSFSKLNDTFYKQWILAVACSSTLWTLQCRSTGHRDEQRLTVISPEL